MSRSCHNKTYAAGYWTTERVINVIHTETTMEAIASLVPKFIPHTMSKDCRYDFKATDPECEGCKWKTNS